MASCERHTGGADRGDIVVGWLVRVIAVLALIGVAAFDSFSIGSSRLSIEDQASSAARAAADAWATSHDAQTAFDSAYKSAIAANANNEISVSSFSIDPAGQAHLVVHREAPTFVIHLIHPLRHWALVHADGVSKAPTT